MTYAASPWIGGTMVVNEQQANLLGAPAGGYTIDKKDSNRESVQYYSLEDSIIK